MPDQQTSSTPSSGSDTGGIDISGIITSAGQALSSSLKDIVSSMPGGGQGQQLTAQGADAIATGKQAVNTANEQAAIKYQQDNAEAAARFGMTPGAPSATVVALSKGIVEGEADIVNRQKMIQAKQDTNFLDDPVGWITNRLTLPFDQAAYEGRVEGITQQLSVLKELATRTTEQYQVNAGIDTGASIARLDGLNKEALGEALLQKADSAFKAAQIGVEAANVRIAASRTEFDSQVALSNSIAETKRLDLEASGQTIQLKQVGIQQQELDLGKQRFLIEQNADARAAESHTMEMTIQGLTAGTMQERVQAQQMLQTRIDNFLKITGVMGPNGENRITWPELNLMSDGPLKRCYNARDDGSRYSARAFRLRCYFCTSECQCY